MNRQIYRYNERVIYKQIDNYIEYRDEQVDGICIINSFPYLTLAYIYVYCMNRFCAFIKYDFVDYDKNKNVHNLGRGNIIFRT